MNKFRVVQGMEGELPNASRPAGVYGFVEGYRGDVDSNDAPPDSARDLLDIVWDGDGIRADFGRTFLLNGTRPILALTALINEPTYKLLRLDYNSVSGEAEVYSYNAFLSTWSLEASTPVTVSPGYTANLASQILGDIVYFGSEREGILVYDDSAGILFPHAGGAPSPRALIIFGDRIIAAGDHSVGGAGASALSWTTDGTFLWTGGDSGQIALIDSTMRKVDPINGLAVVGENVLAIIREGSIYRGFETGNIVQAIGALSWIEGYGTRSPRTVKQVPGGAIFLGSDSNVYFLSSGGLKEIGTPIRDRLKAFNGLDTESVGAYSEALGMYFLSIVNQSNAVETWSISLEDAQKGKSRWRRHSWTPLNMVEDLVGMTSGSLGLIFSDESNDVWKYGPDYDDANLTPFEGFWVTQMLFRDDPGFSHRVTALAIEYEAAIESIIAVDVSVNGDGVWDDTLMVTLPSTAGSSHPQRAIVGLNETGPKMTLRFRIMSDDSPIIRKYIPLAAQASSIFR